MSIISIELILATGCASELSIYIVIRDGDVMCAR